MSATPDPVPLSARDPSLVRSSAIDWVRPAYTQLSPSDREFSCDALLGAFS